MNKSLNFAEHIPAITDDMAGEAPTSCRCLSIVDVTLNAAEYSMSYPWESSACQAHTQI